MKRVVFFLFLVGVLSLVSASPNNGNNKLFGKWVSGGDTTSILRIAGDGNYYYSLCKNGSSFYCESGSWKIDKSSEKQIFVPKIKRSTANRGSKLIKCLISMSGDNSLVLLSMSGYTVLSANKEQ